MSPTVAQATDALHEYTEPINERVFRKADSLPAGLRSEFVALRSKYQALMSTNFTFHPVFIEKLGAAEPPSLPLRVMEPHTPLLVGVLPDDVLDAIALRQLMERLIENSQRAIDEFDAIFGERA